MTMRLSFQSRDGGPLLDADQVLDLAPPFVRVRQDLASHRVPRVEPLLRARLDETAPSLRPAPGTRVAIAVGSRGIDQIDVVVRGLVEWIRLHQAQPFIVPAMGSHGAGTAEGQATVLAALGIDEASVGAPIRSSMGATKVAEVPHPRAASEAEPVDVFVADEALNADLVIPIARVKPHTDFRGPVQSGLLKMLALALGKHDGARSLHRVDIADFSDVLTMAGTAVLDVINCPFGIAVVEDGFGHLGLIEVIPSTAITSREPELLVQAGRWLPTLPFDDLDVLILTEMGKDISGTGMDPHVTGRYYRLDPEPTELTAGRIVVLGLSEATHGNACGIGMADVVTAQLASRVDWGATYTNEIAARLIEGARLPLVAANTAEAIAVAIQTSAAPAARSRIAWVRNTREVADMHISLPLWESTRHTGALTQVSAPKPLPSLIDDAGIWR